MIVRLEFDLFYTTIEVPEISEKKLRKGFYENVFNRWRHRNGFIFDDDTVIKWLQENRFENEKIKILEKYLSIAEKSNYMPDITLFF